MGFALEVTAGRELLLITPISWVPAQLKHLKARAQTLVQALASKSDTKK